jgi:hypothetical protein
MNALRKVTARQWSLPFVPRAFGTENRDELMTPSKQEGVFLCSITFG